MAPEHLLYSYEDYLKQGKTLLADSFHQVGQEMVSLFQSEQHSISRFAPVAYLLDYSRKQYIYVDEACFDLFGYTAKQWIEEGIEGFLSKWHPQDYQIMNSRVFPENIRFLQNVPPERYKDLIFSFNYRTLNAKGEYITILQRSSFIPSNVPGKPLGSLGVAFDITHYKIEPTVVHTIEEVKQSNNRNYNNLLFKKVYSVQEEHFISPRELEILKWMAEGLSSKQIAKSLGISINTVNNHRKNMLHRTGCRNSTELVNYAMRHGCFQMPAAYKPGEKG